nr:unnamed protein product [Callosobruchus chinensis]
MDAALSETIDFQKICRICMKEGIMMSIFKVNISKKIMSCASVQVWQNDKLPSQICNKCTAKLHISFQFKKQCEKSDARLRQILQHMQAVELHNEVQQSIQETENENQIEQQNEKMACLEITHQIAQAVQGNNCVYIECSPVLESVPQETHNYISVSQSQPPPLTPIDYQQQQLQLQGYNIQGIGPVQVYNGAYIPVHQMQTTDVINNQTVTQMQVSAPAQIQSLESVMQQQQTEPNHNQHISQQHQLSRVPIPDAEVDTNKKQSKNVKKDSKNEASKQCPTCNKIFSSAAKLSRHVKTHSSDLPYKCKFCSKGFAHSGNFKIHVRMHTDERPFKCMICGRGSRQAQDLEKHMRVHTGEKPHKCHICPRAFSTSSNLIAHKRTHTGERPYVCCVCQKGFCQSNELTKHMRTHTGEKSHVCDICHKGFNGSSTLIVHRRSHTGERPYVCPVCGKGFTQSSCLVVHTKRHNLSDTGESQKIKASNDVTTQLQCGVCGKRYAIFL